jgi:hypothetical protein
MVAILVAALGLLATGPSAVANPRHAAGRGRACGVGTLRTPLGPTRARFYGHGNVSCRTVRGVLRRYFSAAPERCQGSGCFIRLRGGWVCSAPSGAVYQQTGRMGQCQAGRRRAVAYKAR